MTKHWYAVSVLSNFEKRVAEAVRDGVEKKNLSDSIFDVVVPTEEVVEIRRGRKVTTERRYMPGYVLVQTDMSDEAYHLIKDTRNVLGFLGPQGKPAPMRDEEVERMLNRAVESAERGMPEILFEIGQQVKLTDGHFEGFTGTVEDVDVENARLTVSVSIFGRATPVNLEYGQVQKVGD